MHGHYSVSLHGFKKFCYQPPSPLEASTWFFFPTCHVLKTWFKLLGVKLHRNDRKGNKDYFELAGGSSYRGFKLLRVKLQ